MYGFLDLLSDLGGVHEIIMVLLGSLIFSISEHHYTLQAAKRMFIARTSDQTLFYDNQKGNCNYESNQKMIHFTSDNVIKSIGGQYDSKNELAQEQSSLSEALRFHKMARLRLKDSVLLYLYNMLYCASCKNVWPLWTWKKRSKLQRIYRETQDRLENELNIVRLIR